MIHSGFVLLAFACVVASSVARAAAPSLTTALIGHWTLRGDCQDHSGRRNHGVNHGVKLDNGTFDGRAAWIEVPADASLQLGTNDFAFSAWIHTEAQVDDAIGDVLDLYDPEKRRGVTLSVNSSASGYLSQGNDRHVYFGIDDAKLGEWEDCGRPSPTSPYVGNSMLVFRGQLYAGTIEGATEADWCHVWRYAGGRNWVDCGRVGNGRTTGVGPLLIHNGELYAVTTTYDWTRVKQGPFDSGKAYRYGGGTNWIDCGTPHPDNRTLNTASSYQGKLYVGSGPKTYAVSVREADGSWKEQHRFDKQGPRSCFPHAMARYNGLLFSCFQSAFSFDGREWNYAGVPVEPQNELQAHCFAIFQGHLIAGTWPLAKVARYHGGEKWEEIGRVGEDGTEVNSLVVYNGKLYGGLLPRKNPRCARLEPDSERGGTWRTDRDETRVISTAHSNVAMIAARLTRSPLFGSTPFISFAVCVLGMCFPSAGIAEALAPPGPMPRPFRMGFTAFPPAVSSEAVEQTRQFVRTNADLIAHHIEGVPWAEALEGRPFPEELVRDHEAKRSMKPPGAKVYLAVSPGRGDLKLAEKGTTPLPPDLRGKPYDDPAVKKAYLNYCRRCIDFFKPDYLAIGIEVNEIFSVGPEKWRAYAELHRHVYRELKREHPKLPIFASYTLHNLIKERGEMLKACLELMPFNDLVGVSFYPFFIGETPDAAFQWLTDQFDPTGKPYALVETNDAAERLELPQSRITLHGTPEKQAAFVRTLLALAERRRFQFVVLFIHQDYDALWDTIKATAPEFFMLWRDCGLIDERGQARPAYAEWRRYWERPLESAAR